MLFTDYLLYARKVKPTEYVVYSEVHRSLVHVNSIPDIGRNPANQNLFQIILLGLGDDKSTELNVRAAT